MSKQSNNPHLPLVILALLALAFVPILLSLNKKITQPKAQTCTADQCSTATGCQLTGYVLNLNGVDYTCVGNNQWTDPEGNNYTGNAAGPVVTVTTTGKDYTPIAERIFSWLSNSHDPQGLYFSLINCKDGNCTNMGSSNNSGIAAVWSRFRHYKATRNQEDLALIESDLNTYLDEQIAETVQTNIWGCKMLYELNTSDLPEIAKLKDKISQLCQRVLLLNVERDEIDQQLEVGRSMRPDFTPLSSGGRISTFLKANSEERVNYAFLASDYANRYLWFNDQADLNRAEGYFSKAASLVNYMDKEDTLGFLPVLGVAAIDLYRITNENGYLNQATLIADQLSASNQCSALNDCVYQAVFVDSLIASVNLPKYHEYQQKILDFIIKEGYDENTGAVHHFATVNSTNYIPFVNMLLAGTLISGTSPQ